MASDNFVFTKLKTNLYHLLLQFINRAQMERKRKETRKRKEKIKEERKVIQTENRRQKTKDRRHKARKEKGKKKQEKKNRWLLFCFILSLYLLFL